MYRNYRVDLRKKFHIGDILVSKAMGFFTHVTSKCKIVAVRRNTVRVKALKEASGLYRNRYYTFKDFELFGSWELCMNGIQRAKSVLKRAKRRDS
jgi:hypothetical protein